MGVFSAGIDMNLKQFFTESDLLGDFVKLNPVFAEHMKARGLWSHDIVKKLNVSNGSVQNVAGISALRALRTNSTWFT